MEMNKRARGEGMIFSFWERFTNNSDDYKGEGALLITGFVRIQPINFKEK